MVESNHPPDQETSKFNEAGLAVLRLHELWIAAEQAAQAGNLTGWRWILDSIWRELYADVLRLKDSKKFLEENVNHSKLWVISKTDSQFYFVLNKRHSFLKEVQDKAGKGGSYESTTEGDFE